MDQDARPISHEEFQELMAKLSAITEDNRAMNRLSIRVEHLEDRYTGLERSSEEIRNVQEAQRRSINTLNMRIDSQDDQLAQFHAAIGMSNELHEKHREALDSLSGMISEMRDLVRVWSGAKSTLKVAVWVGSALKWLAYTIGAGMALYLFITKGIPIKWAG